MIRRTLAWMAPGHCWLVVPVLLLVGGGVGDSSGAGLRDIQDSWLVTPEESRLLLTGRGSGPQGLQAPGTLAFVDLGQGRLFSVPGLEQTQISGLARFRLLGRALLVEGGWQQLGSGVFREHESWLAVLLGSNPGLGLGVARTQATIENQASSQPGRLTLEVEHSLVLGLGMALRGRLSLGLAQPSPVIDPHARRKFARLALLCRGGALGLRLDRRPNGTPVLDFEVFLGSEIGVGFSLRLDPASGTLGPGLQVNRGALLIRTSHLYHPDLGPTHRVSLCLIRSHV